MGLEFLARIRRSTLWLGGIAALVIATYVAPLSGAGLAAGALASLANLALIEMLVVAITTPGPNKGRTRAALALAGMITFFAAGALLLRFLPAMWLMIGFGVPFLVMLMKAVALLLIESGLWTRFIARPWRATLAVGAVAFALWLGLGALPGASAQRKAAPASHQLAAATDAGKEVVAEAEKNEAAGAGGEKKEKEPGFPTVITLLEAAQPHAAWLPFVVHYEALLFSLFIAALICLLAFIASREAKMIPGNLQNAVEALVETLHDFVVGILGPKYGRRYLPFLGTLFIYILAMNLFGLIPFMHSPTASLNVTVALALTVFVYVQYTGIRGLGIVGYLDHLIGTPRDVISWLLVPLMLPIHVLGELAKPISLSCRLFGNVFGEDMLLVAFATLGIITLPLAHVPFGLPLHLLFIPLALLSSVLQALVFTVLSTVYFLLMLPHDDHGHEEKAQPAH
jgi:F-type H+-transporting ATPase subunit a